MKIATNQRHKSYVKSASIWAKVRSISKYDYWQIFSLQISKNEIVCQSISFAYLLECDEFSSIPGAMVQCFDGTCIDGSYVCDGEVDCPEYEDVDDDGNSVKFKHNEDEYLCPDWMKEAEEYDEYTNLLNEFTKLLGEYELDILNSFKLILQKLQ